MNVTKQAVAAISEEARAHVERTSKLRFKRNLIGGISGPIIFGMVVALSNNIVMMTAAATWVLPVIAAAAAVFAVSALYANSRLDAQIMRFDQEYQAQQISKGISGPAPTIEQKPITFPAQNTAQAVADAPTKTTADLSANKPTLVVDNVTSFGRTALPAPESARGQA